LVRLVLNLFSATGSFGSGLPQHGVLQYRHHLLHTAQDGSAEPHQRGAFGCLATWFTVPALPGLTCWFYSSPPQITRLQGDDGDIGSGFTLALHWTTDWFCACCLPARFRRVLVAFFGACSVRSILPLQTRLPRSRLPVLVHRFTAAQRWFCVGSAVTHRFTAAACQNTAYAEQFTCKLHQFNTIPHCRFGEHRYRSAIELHELAGSHTYQFYHLPLRGLCLV
jgi:hypothetical protein